MNTAPEQDATLTEKILNQVEILMSGSGHQVDPQQVICMLIDAISLKHLLSAIDIENDEQFEHFLESLNAVMHDNRQKYLDAEARQLSAQVH